MFVFICMFVGFMDFMLGIFDMSFNGLGVDINCL